MIRPTVGTKINCIDMIRPTVGRIQGQLTSEGEGSPCRGTLRPVRLRLHEILYILQKIQFHLFKLKDGLNDCSMAETKTMEPMGFA